MDATSGQGKERSSRNAIRTGLYAARDFIRSGEEEEYAQTLIKLMGELTPEGTLEQTFATEIMGATWRLRRCRLVEEAFSSVDDLDFDPMMDEPYSFEDENNDLSVRSRAERQRRWSKQQKSVDRARAQSHLILRRSIAELSKLQTARTIRKQLNAQDIGKAASAPAAPESAPSGLDALMALADKQLAQRYRESGLSSFCNPHVGQVSDLHSSKSQTSNPGSTSSFCKTTPAAPAAPTTTEPASQKKTGGQTPRNAPCPCRSGLKFKKCCGNPAREANSAGLSDRKPGNEQSPVLNKAA